MSCEKEAKARIKINKLLEESSWRLLDDTGFCLKWQQEPVKP